MRQLGRSLIYTKNRSGPRLLPCGTPQETGAVFDKWPFVLHFWFRSQRYDSNHLRLLESTPYFRSFRIRIVWSMVSKAFFQIDENHTIYKAIVDIDRPTISSFNQCSECTVQSTFCV